MKHEDAFDALCDECESFLGTVESSEVQEGEALSPRAQQAVALKNAARAYVRTVGGTLPTPAITPFRRVMRDGIPETDDVNRLRETITAFNESLNGTETTDSASGSGDDTNSGGDGEQGGDGDSGNSGGAFGTFEGLPADTNAREA